MAIGFLTHGLLCPFCFSLGHPWPICFLWASLALLLTLHSHELLLTLLDLPGPITLFSSLGFMGLPLTPYFFCLHYYGPVVAHSHFSISYTAYGYAISLFPGFFKPIYLLKPVCLFHEPVIHYSYRLGLMVLPLICQPFVALVARLFSFYLDSQK